MSLDRFSGLYVRWIRLLRLLVACPLNSNVLIKRYCTTSIYSAIIVADMNQLILAGYKKEERIGGVTDDYREQVAAGILEYNHSTVHSHKCPKIDPAKIIN